ncbi:unnamed protein product [Mucor hiemalis]
MAGTFKIVSKPGRKISLERSSHRCPKCKHCASVQLIRSEKQWLLFNKCISSVMRVRYECSKCNWHNDELPYQDDDINSTIDDNYSIVYHHNSSKASSIYSTVF